MDYQKYIIIIPTYNEKSNIKKLIPILKKYNLHVLVVDDNSPDNTAVEVKHLITKFDHIYLLERSSKQGLGSAYREGFKFALDKGYEYLIQMDADFSHTVKDLISMIKQSNEFDLVIGSRYIKGGETIGWNKSRKLLSKTANLYSRFLCGYKIYDSTSGFRIYSSKALISNNYQKTKSDGYGFQIEMTFRSFVKDLKIIEVPINFHERREGKSKMSRKIIFEAIFLVIRLRLSKNRLATT